MWEDMRLYWAWRGNGMPTQPPSQKRLVYADITHGDKKISICCGVYDDDRFSEMNAEEIQWHKDLGATVTYQGQ